MSKMPNVRPNLYVDTQAMPRKYKRRPIGWEPPAKNSINTAHIKQHDQQPLLENSKCRTIASFITLFFVFTFIALDAPLVYTKKYIYEQHKSVRLFHDPNQFADVGYRGRGYHGARGHMRGFVGEQQGTQGNMIEADVFPSLRHTYVSGSNYHTNSVALYEKKLIEEQLQQQREEEEQLQQRQKQSQELQEEEEKQQQQEQQPQPQEEKEEPQKEEKQQQNQEQQNQQVEDEKEEQQLYEQPHEEGEEQQQQLHKQPHEEEEGEEEEEKQQQRDTSFRLASLLDERSGYSSQRCVHPYGCDKGKNHNFDLLSLPLFSMMSPGLSMTSFQDDALAQTSNFYSRMQENSKTGGMHGVSNPRLSIAAVMDPWKREALQWEVLMQHCSTFAPQISKQKQKVNLRGTQDIAKTATDPDHATAVSKSILNLCESFPTLSAFVGRSKQGTFATLQFNTLCPLCSSSATSYSTHISNAGGNLGVNNDREAEEQQGGAEAIGPPKEDIFNKEKFFHSTADTLNKFDQVLIMDMPIESKVLLHLKFGIPFVVLPYLTHRPTAGSKSMSLKKGDFGHELTTGPNNQQWETESESGVHGGSGHEDTSPEDRLAEVSTDQMARVASGRLKEELEMYQHATRRFRMDIKKYPNFERYCVVLRAVEERLERTECGLGRGVHIENVYNGDEELMHCVKEAIRAVFSGH